MHVICFSGNVLAGPLHFVADSFTEPARESEAVCATYVTGHEDIWLICYLISPLLLSLAAHAQCTQTSTFECAHVYTYSYT